MALVSCPDCGKKISDAAPTCPNCGRPMVAPPPTPSATPPSDSTPTVVIGCLGILLLMGVCTITAGREADSARPTARAPATPSPPSRWVTLIPGQRVTTHPDSVRRVGAGIYAVVIRREGPGSQVELMTEHVECRTLRTQTVRVRRYGVLKGDTSTPDAAWESTSPGSTRAVMLAKVCELGIARAMQP